MPELTCDILIVGGGTGGCAAAIAACELGMSVILTEETRWIGGQLTSQAVPPDEHPWIESYGCTRTYREYRNRVRTWYRNYGMLTPEAAALANLNPGNGWVSRLCHDPRVGVQVLSKMLAPYVTSGKLTILLAAVPHAAGTYGDTVTDVTVRDLESGEEVTINARTVLDATELGDLLDLTKTEFRTGAESHAEFGEPHAPPIANPDDIQAFTWCFAMGFAPGTHNVADPPRDYARWKSFIPEMSPPWPGPLLSWTVADVRKLQPRTFSLFGDLSMFTYRRIVDGSHFKSRPHDVTIVNWAQNDCIQRVIGGTECNPEQALEDAHQLSLSLFHWLQTEAERHDGGYGYPELYLDGDIVGTATGLAMAPYHREARRIVSEFTVTENHVGVDARSGFGAAEWFEDSVGIGAYRIDLHPSTGGQNSIDISSYPFQIPLGSLIPVRVQNLLPACKNLGVTHITNGCYRLHPVEWNIGEAAGALAAYCLVTGMQHSDVREKPEKLAEFQNLLVKLGVELKWPEEAKSTRL